jgi:5-methyltetrahydropteroyltriglutamate--homocysteine methyltransferase
MSEVFRAEVVGSMLRPPFLMRARERFEAGEMPLPEFKRLEDRAVDQVVAMQEGNGVIDWPNPLAATSKLRRRRSLVAEEYSYARGQARKPLKVTVPSPLILYGVWSPEHSKAAYPDPFHLFADAAEIVRAEVQELVALGCEYIQVDAPELATLVDPGVREWCEARSMPAERMLTEGIDLIGSTVEGVEGVKLGIHLCRGNNAGMWMAEGGYDEIAQALFERTAAFDTYLLEYDDHRSGSFEPLSGAPDDSTVVLGLVSTKTPELEAAGELRGRIDQAARHFPQDQLALSTQCGFASIVDGNPLTETAELEKLRLVADLAHEVWS